jgi:hypothetical protein
MGKNEEDPLMPTKSRTVTSGMKNLPGFSIKPPMRHCLLRLGSRLSLGLQVRRDRAASEETGEQWLDEGVEDDLGAARNLLALLG